jgi:hypothetical protein
MERKPMAKTRKAKKGLTAKDFCGEGEPYSEVVVTISIRVLGAGITRSRLAVNTFPDPALKLLAIQTLKHMKIDSYGLNADGIFGACLSENFNGWEDMNEDYPRIAQKGLDEFREHDAREMNAYIKRSVDWVMELHRRGMAEAALNDAGAPPTSSLQ